MISSILAYGIIPPFFLSTFPTWAMSLGFGLLVFGTLFRFFHDWLFYWPADHDNEIKIKPIRASAFQHDYFETPEMVAKKDKKKAMYDTIVIGTGSGGCACANLLAQSGQKVLVLEQHEERTGGCTHTFRDNGCEWDTGLHVRIKEGEKLCVCMHALFWYNSYFPRHLCCFSVRCSIVQLL